MFHLVDSSSQFDWLLALTDVCGFVEQDSFQATSFEFLLFFVPRLLEEFSLCDWEPGSGFVPAR
jgi:hypothetical protein